jgi:BioD-like phosphotransacetylase family protein
MSFLFIGSTGDNAGHTLLTWAIVKRLTERGVRCGFIKPFGTHPVQVDGLWTDHDAVLFKEALRLSEPLAEICPYPVADSPQKESEAADVLEGLKRSIRKLSEGKDVLVIMGSRHIFYDDAERPLPDISLVPALGADFVLVHRYRQASKSIYSILSVCSLLREHIRGIVFNRVAPADLPSLREKVLPSLVQKGVPALAAVPEDPLLSFRTLREVREVLGGEILSGKADLERPVASMTVGLSDLPSELLLFKRAYNKIVLLSWSDDIRQEGDTVHRPVAGILLTGGRPPAPQLIQAAEKAAIPLLLVQPDTFAVLERLEQSPSVLSWRDEVKLHRFSGMLDRENGLQKLIDRLGVPA